VTFEIKFVAGHPSLEQAHLIECAGFKFAIATKKNIPIFLWIHAGMRLIAESTVDSQKHLLSVVVVYVSRINVTFT